MIEIEVYRRIATVCIACADHTATEGYVAPDSLIVGMDMKRARSIGYEPARVQTLDMRGGVESYCSTD